MTPRITKPDVQQNIAEAASPGNVIESGKDKPNQSRCVILGRRAMTSAYPRKQ